MLIPRLGWSVCRLAKLNRPCSVLLYRNFASNKDILDDDGKPIPFSTSPVANWKAEYHRIPPHERVWYTPYVVSASVATFMIYFCILREENDIDELIYQPLTNTIEGIDQVYPGFDFTEKPDYVRYHEKKKEMKRNVKEEQKTS